MEIAIPSKKPFISPVFHLTEQFRPFRSSFRLVKPHHCFKVFGLQKSKMNLIWNCQNKPIQVTTSEMPLPDLGLMYLSFVVNLFTSKTGIFNANRDPHGQGTQSQTQSVSQSNFHSLNNENYTDFISKVGDGAIFEIDVNQIEQLRMVLEGDLYSKDQRLDDQNRIMGFELDPRKVESRNQFLKCLKSIFDPDRFEAGVDSPNLIDSIKMLSSLKKLFDLEQTSNESRVKSEFEEFEENKRQWKILKSLPFAMKMSLPLEAVRNFDNVKGKAEL